MIELCAAHFCGEQPRKVTIANRTAGPRRGRWPPASAPT